MNYVLRQGMTPEETVAEFHHLSLARVYDVRSYYYDSQSEIDRNLAADTEDAVRA